MVDVDASGDVVALSSFDASKHITKVTGRDYLEVKWRLVWLRSEYPHAVIKTDLMHHERNAAVFRAEVTLVDSDGVVRGSATGWGSEAADDFGDYLEKAETKALGRALAACGFGTQFCQDFDFGAERGRVVDAPVDIRGAGRPAASGPQPATPKQITYLRAIAREAGLSEDDLEARAHESFGAPLAELGRRGVSQLIEQIQSQRTAP